MPANPNTKVTLLLIPAILFALAGVSALVAAFGDSPHPRARIARVVMWFSFSIVFFSVASRKRKAIHSEQGDSSNKSQ